MLKLQESWYTIWKILIEKCISVITAVPFMEEISLFLEESTEAEIIDEERMDTGSSSRLIMSG